MNDVTIAFIGGGNMATALVGGMLSAVDAKALSVSEPSGARRRHLAERFPGIAVHADNAAAAATADIVFLATKPDVLPSVCNELRTAALTASRTFVSIAAGVRIAKLAGWLGPTAGVIRAMPNQPALVGQGLTALIADSAASERVQRTVDALFASTGDTLWLADESMMDACTALSGSGPAYFYRFMEILADYGERAGFTPADARRIAVTTALGAATLARDSDTDLADLRASVTSPGGTTAAALGVLDAADIHDILSQAIEAAVMRGQQLDAESSKESDD
ncbi:MAG: pyrroline-5-carboxylate reductase [Pseudomonadota bacterium]